MKGKQDFFKVKGQNVQISNMNNGQQDNRIQGPLKESLAAAKDRDNAGSRLSPLSSHANDVNNNCTENRSEIDNWP